MGSPIKIKFNFQQAITILMVWFLILKPGICLSQKIFGFALSGDSLLENYEMILDDPLISGSLTFGEISKFSFQGRFSRRGWRTDHQKGFLKIELAEPALGEGALQITIDGADWDNRKSDFFESGNEGTKMINFLNMFSSEDGNFLVEQDQNKNSCFWSLANRFPENNSPHENNFRLIWSSYGYINSPVSRYSEKANLLPEGWLWDKNEYVFTIIWSKNEELLSVYIDGILFYRVDWYRQEKALKTIYLGRAGVFSSLQNVLFRDLKIYAK